MTLTKAIITEKVAVENGWSAKQSAENIEQLLGIMKYKLASGDDLLISGFGKFHVKSKKERRGRNPATGDDIILRLRKVVTCKGSARLRDHINKV